MPLLAEISWPLAVAGVIVAVFVVTWPMYRRLARQANLAAAQGDYASALAAIMRLHRSLLPAALLERLLNPGYFESVIARRLYQLDRGPEALEWCMRASKRARRPRTKALLHDLAASMWSWRGDVEKCEQHLSALAETLQKNPVPELDWATTAIICESHLGRLDAALRIAQEENRRCGGQISTRGLIAMLQVLHALGRHADVLRLTEWLLEEAAPEPRNPLSDAQNPEAALGLTQLRASYLRAIRAVPLVLAARSALATGHWSLFQRHLSALDPSSQSERLVGAELAGLRAAWHAHNGDRQAVATEQEAVDSLIEQYPNQRKFRAYACLYMAESWQILGEHEKAMALLSRVDPAALPPVDRSLLAATMAGSLEALSQAAQAEAKREEARRLAPLAYWNQPQRTANEAALATLLPEVTPPSEGVTIRTTADPLADQPVEPLASGVACAAWVLAVPALIPLLGSLPAVALLILSLILLFRNNRRLHDRRIGAAALAISVFSLGCTVLAGFNLTRMVFEDAQGHHPPATSPSVDERRDEGAETSDAGFLALQVEQEDADDALVPPEPPARRMPTDSERTGGRFDERPTPIWHHILVLAVLVGSIVFHEIAHAVAALWSGDTTARDLGRISLNPIRHVDLFGSFIVPLVLILLPGNTVIGWAKPVPIRPPRFRHYRRGNLGVSLAGVSLNLMLAFFAVNVLMIVVMVLGVLYPGERHVDLRTLVLEPIRLVGVPYAPLWIGVIEVCKTAVLINLALVNLNLLPLPPLDGFGALRSILPNFAVALTNKLGGVGLIVLFFLLASRVGHFLFVPAVLLSMLLLTMAMFLGGWSV